MKQQVLDCFAKLFGGEGDIRTYFALTCEPDR